MMHTNSQAQNGGVYTYQYVPLLKTEVLLHDSSVLEEIEHCKSRIHSNDKLEDFCNGTIFKQHSLFPSDPKNMHITMTLK